MKRLSEVLAAHRDALAFYAPLDSLKQPRQQRSDECDAGRSPVGSAEGLAPEKSRVGGLLSRQSRDAGSSALQVSFASDYPSAFEV